MSDTIPARMLRLAQTMGSSPAYYTKRDGQYRPVTWERYTAQAVEVAKALIELGVEPGQTTAAIGFNTPDWTSFYLGTMLAGAAGAGVYTTSSPKKIAYILDHAEARVVLVEDAEQWSKIDSIRASLPQLKKIVLMHGAAPVDDEQTLTWEAFCALGRQRNDEDVHQRVQAIQPSEIGTLIYTSGTTGPPKAVMLSHENLSWTAEKVVEITGASSEDYIVSYLPLSHIAEQMFTIHGAVSAGYAVYFAESMAQLPVNLQEVQPTLVFGVPRVWEKMYTKVSDRLRAATGLRAKIAEWCMEVGNEVTNAHNQGASLSPGQRLKYRIADRLLFSKVKPLLGLKNARFCVTAAAPISEDVLQFFARLDVPLHEVYGQSEVCGPSTINLPGATRFGTVGTTVTGTEIKIAEDGEILVRGPHVFQGYLKNPEATEETLIDGWLHSGDLGSFDGEHLVITGRKKDIIITAGGKNISPQNIESALREIPLVSQAVVIGDRRKHLSALVTVDLESEAVQEFFSSNHHRPTEPHESEALRQYLQTHIDEQVNPQFAQVEHIRKFTVLPRELAEEHGELTPTMKIKRRVVNDNWANEIEAIYR